MKGVYAAFAFAVCFGCGKEAVHTVAEVPATPAAPGEVLTLEGPGGAVALGDSIDAAQAAFPAPEGAQEFDHTANFTILYPDGWAWVHEGSGAAFEVATEDGRIVGIVSTMFGDIPTEAPDEQRRILGEPTAEAVGEHAALLVWESVDNARFFILMKEFAPFGSAAITMIGPKEKIKMFGYDYSNPSAFVKMIDQASSIGAVSEPPE